MYSFKRFLVVALIPLFAILPSITLAQAAKDATNTKSESIAEGGGKVEEEALHQHPTHSAAHKNEVAESPVEAIFHKMDSDHDAMLSLDEFVTNFSIIGKEGGSSSGTNGSKSGFWKGFSSSTMMIIATEIGDKTFFIAAVLSMRNSRLVVFSGAIFALICMTILSTMMGLVLPSIMPKQYTHIIGGILFLYFGVKLIYDSRSMSDKVSDELEEVEEELLQHNKKKDETDIESNAVPDSSSSSSSPKSPSVSSAAGGENTKVFMQAFLLTFLAEWGDRSQIATIALAAAKNPYGVTIGGCLGHSLCTGLAVIGGRMLASKISEKTVSFWGGCIFLAFGVHSLFFDSSE